MILVDNMPSAVPMLPHGPRGRRCPGTSSILLVVGRRVLRLLRRARRTASFGKFMQMARLKANGKSFEVAAVLHT